MVKNIILDIGKVLIQWEPKLAMRELGIEEEAIDAAAEAVFASGAWNEEDRGLLSDEEVLEFLIHQAPSYGKEIRLFWENVNLAARQFPYARPWISGMKEQGYQVYILSNYGKWTFEKTKDEALSFLQDVDGALFSYEVRQIKPEAEIYQSFLQKFGLRPEECVFIDDMPANIRGAEAAGIHGIIFQNIVQAKEELKKYDV